MADVENLYSEVESMVNEVNAKITLGMKSRAYRVSNELRNASQLVLRGKRSGRRYRKPGTRAYYTASAPGEPPAVRFGHFRASWQTKTEETGTGDSLSVKAMIESSIRTDTRNGKSYLLGQILEEGTSKTAPRPYKQKIQEKAKPKVLKIYKEPYF